MSYKDLHTRPELEILTTLKELATQTFTNENYSEVLFDETELLIESESELVSFWARRVNYPLCRIKVSNESIPDEQGEKVSFCLSELKQHGQKINIVLLGILAQSGEATVLPHLLAFLKKCQDPFKISLLVKHLGCFDDSRIITVLTPFVNHMDDRVVANCVEGLIMNGSDRSFPIYIQLLCHTSLRVQTNAYQGIMSFSKEKIDAALSLLLHKCQEPFLEAILLFIERSIAAGSEHLHFLFRYLKLEKYRFRVMELIESHGDESTCIALSAYLKENPDQQRFGEVVIQKIKARLRASVLGL